jgi:DNA adenine methylase
MAGFIVKHFREHQTYVEPFGGGASVLLAKDPSPVEVYNDKLSAVVHFFSVLRDRESAEEIARLARFTPYSRELFLRYRESWKEEQDPVERAFQWFYVQRSSFGGEGGGWSYAVAQSTRGRPHHVSGYQTTTSGLVAVSERLRRVQIEHLDFRDVITKYDRPRTLFYCDPPYVPSTRRRGGYKHELTLQDHEDLVDLLLSIKGSAVLSGYEHEVYAPLLSAGWEIVRRNRCCLVQTSGDNKRVECLYISPEGTK